MKLGYCKEEKIMAFNAWKLHTLRGSIARRVFFRTILFATAMSIFPFLQLSCDKETMITFEVKSDSNLKTVASKDSHLLSPEQFLKPISSYAFSKLPTFLAYKENEKLTTKMFRELIDMKLLNSNVKALCVGEGSALAVSELRRLGFTNAIGVKRHLFSYLTRKSLIRELDLDDLEHNSFDFVFSRAPSMVSVPALFVIEIERILKSGGIGAIVLEMTTLNPGSLIKTFTPISSFLKSSDVIHVSSVDSFSVVVFKKKQDTVNPFEHYQLPDECASIKNTKPLIEHLEPLVEKKPLGREGNFSYLPKFLDVSSRKRFIYIDIGPGQFVSSNVKNRFFNSYPLNSRDFNIYVVDHDTTVLTSYVNKPGITFVYHPDLSGSKIAEVSEEVDDFFPYLSDEGFDFLVWFRSIVTEGDFVVLKMNAAGVELKFLHELFETGAICLVDELFLHCPESADTKDGARGDCVDMFEGLRNSGVFVHQWRDN
ncbi:hypothetical protein MKX01_031964 [Papaver californicum]|nr:hypothetical protein MKX01_031964 [Papaver californicum]